MQTEGFECPGVPSAEKPSAEKPRQCPGVPSAEKPSAEKPRHCQHFSDRLRPTPIRYMRHMLHMSFPANCTGTLSCRACNGIGERPRPKSSDVYAAERSVLVLGRGRSPLIALGRHERTGAHERTGRANAPITTPLTGARTHRAHECTTNNNAADGRANAPGARAHQQQHR